MAKIDKLAGRQGTWPRRCVSDCAQRWAISPVANQTTERYLQCKQKFRDAVHDRMGIEPEASHGLK